MRKIKDYFRFNSRERLAIILLTCLLGLFWILPQFYPSKPMLVLTAFDQKILQIQDSLNAKDSIVDQSEYKHRNTFFRPQKKEQQPLMETRKEAAYFYFDPNTIDEAQWEQLGLPHKTIQTILNYRNKGGHFYRPGDLKKIWGLKPEEANLLMPYVRIPTNEQSSKDFPKGKLNVNTATQEEWELFPGIGPVLAARIIKFRDKIGGFTTVDQVGKTYGISDSVFQKILPYLAMEEKLPEK